VRADDLAQRGAHGAFGALQRRGDMLDVHLEADGRPALREVLEGERRGAALHPADHARRREHRRRDRPADVGEQRALHGERFDALGDHGRRP
jgi:hypothetical protein